MAKRGDKAPNSLKLNLREWDRIAVMAVLCERIASSSRSLSSILKEPYNGNSLPDVVTIMAWFREDELLTQQYARAKEQQADYMAEEMIDIADDGRNDYMAENGNTVLDHEHIQRSKLRIEARKWLMGKLRPKKYGDKLAIGGDDDMPAIKQSVDVKMTPAEAYREIIGG